eukprot:5473897-Prymnesium_polylepis.1
MAPEIFTDRNYGVSPPAPPPSAPACLATRYPVGTRGATHTAPIHKLRGARCVRRTEVRIE